MTKKREWLELRRSPKVTLEDMRGIAPDAHRVLLAVISSLPVEGMEGADKQAGVLGLIDAGLLRVQMRLNRTGIDVRWHLKGVTPAWQHNLIGYGPGAYH